MDLLLTLRRTLALWPDREAVVDGDRRFSYREFGRRVARTAGALEALDLGGGRVIAILAPNSHAFLETYYAAAAAGAVLAPINHRLAPRETAAILEDCEAAALIADTRCAELARSARALLDGTLPLVWIGPEAQAALAPGDHDLERLATGQADTLPDRAPLASSELAHLYYTSGTTGEPKGVMLTHGNVTFHALAAIAELGLTDSDVWLHAAPLFHLADAWATFAITWAGGKHVCLPFFEAGEALALLEHEHVTVTNLIPTMLTLMVHHETVGARDLTSLRQVMSGGAPIAPETVRRIVERFGCEFVQTYGMTETSPYLTVSRLAARHQTLSAEEQLALRSRTGRPFLGVDLRLVREDGREVACDDREVGEIIVRGPTVSPGYWHRPGATAEAIRNGWLHTGDLAVINAEGYLDIVGRKQEMIITGGENVYPTEVENVLYEHPAVLECAVVGRPDPIWGEAVKAFVVRRPGAACREEELMAFARERLAAFKTPRTVEFLAALPRTGSGKIARRRLRDCDADASGSGS